MAASCSWIAALCLCGNMTTVAEAQTSYTSPAPTTYSGSGPAPGASPPSIDHRVGHPSQPFSEPLSPWTIDRPSQPFGSAGPSFTPPQPRSAEAPTPIVSGPAGSVRTPIHRGDSGATAPAKSGPATFSWVTTAVLAVCVLLAWLGPRCIQNRHGAGGRGWRRRLPEAAVQCLGTSSLTPQLAIHLVQVGDRLLILGSSPEGLRTLSEITDPAEQTHLAHLCCSESPADAPHPLIAWWSAISRRGAANGSAPTPRAVPEQPTPQSPIESSLPAARRTAGALRRHAPLGAVLLAIAIHDGAVHAAAPIGSETQRPFVALPASESYPLDDRSPPLAARTDAGAGLRRSDSAWPLAPTAPHQPVARFADASAELPPPQAAAGLAPASPAPASFNAPLSTVGVAFDVGAWNPVGMMRMAVLLGVMSLAPAILLMTTCYVRIIVVLGLLRQALGVPQFPPTQVLNALALFLTALVMWPVWSESYHQGIVPLAEAERSGAPLEWSAAWQATVAPTRRFMSRQLEATGNTAAVDLFLDFHADAGSAGGASLRPQYYEDVPLQALFPAYVLSELKTAFLIGFRLYLPFIVIDLVVASLLATMGLQAVPPATVALPLKLLLFVLIDGWFLTVDLLLQGIGA